MLEQCLVLVDNIYEEHVSQHTRYGNRDFYGEHKRRRVTSLLSKWKIRRSSVRHILNAVVEV